MKANELSVRLTIATVVACCCVSAATAQNMNIRGRVYDKTDNQPVSNAFITIERGTVSDRDGLFNLDSIKVSVQQESYLPYQKMLPGNYEGNLDILLERSPWWSDTLNIRYGVLPRGIRGGRILDAEGKPVEGASVIITGTDLPVMALASDSQGAFRTGIILGSDHHNKGKNIIFTNLNIVVPGHKLFDYRFKSKKIDNPLKRVKHDGLVIEIDFYE